MTLEIVQLLQNQTCAPETLSESGRKALVSFWELIDFRKWLAALSLRSIAGFMDHQITYIEQQDEEEGGTNTDFYGGISRAGKRKRV